MSCTLRKNDYPEIELLFGKQNDSIYFDLDFYKQFLQEETEEKAKEWCLKTVERDIFEHLEEISPSEKQKLADFFDDYYGLSKCFDELKKYSESVMHNVWNPPKQIFKVGQAFSVISAVIRREYGELCKKNHTFNLFPEMYGNDSNLSFYISEISKFDSSSYKLELSMNECYGVGGGAIIEKLKFIIQKGDVLTFKYYEKSEKTYFVNATMTNIKNNEIEFEFGLFDENCLLN